MYILQKNWTKTVNPALSSGLNFFPPPIWGHHHQLDDQQRNPNMNNRDHLVGQLTRGNLTLLKKKKLEQKCLWWKCHSSWNWPFWRWQSTWRRQFPSKRALSSCLIIGVGSYFGKSPYYIQEHCLHAQSLPLPHYHCHSLWIASKSVEEFFFKDIKKHLARLQKWPVNCD